MMEGCGAGFGSILVIKDPEVDPEGLKLTNPNPNANPDPQH